MRWKACGLGCVVSGVWSPGPHPVLGPSALVPRAFVPSVSVSVPRGPLPNTPNTQVPIFALPPPPTFAPLPFVRLPLTLLPSSPPSSLHSRSILAPFSLRSRPYSRPGSRPGSRPVLAPCSRPGFRLSLKVGAPALQPRGRPGGFGEGGGRHEVVPNSDQIQTGLRGRHVQPGHSSTSRKSRYNIGSSHPVCSEICALGNEKFHTLIPDTVTPDTCDLAP